MAVVGEYGGVMKQAVGFRVGILETVAEENVTKVLVNRCAIHIWHGQRQVKNIVGIDDIVN
jgi:hypothetical protein